LKVHLDQKHLLKTLALMLGGLNDGLSKREIYKSFEPALDKYDKEQVDSLLEFGLENGWIIESDEGRYVLTLTGKEFVTSQLR
jgi:hypothetical protein